MNECQKKLGKEEQSEKEITGGVSIGGGRHGHKFARR